MKELRYVEFGTAVAKRRILGGVLRYAPLKTEFKTDYAELAARYTATYPDFAIPE